MPLGMEIGLNPDHIVLDGDPFPLPKIVSDVAVFVLKRDVKL